MRSSCKRTVLLKKEEAMLGSITFAAIVGAVAYAFAHVISLMAEDTWESSIESEMKDRDDARRKNIRLRKKYLKEKGKEYDDR